MKELRCVSEWNTEWVVKSKKQGVRQGCVMTLQCFPEQV
jgi:hypothetical protein